MPHQCLSCGFAFEEGSSALLKGCPECKGTKFFYTPDTATATERKEIAKEVQGDLRQVVAEALQNAAPETAHELQASADADGWAELKPKDLRKLVKKVQAETGRNAKQADLDPDATLTPSEHAARRKQAAEAARRLMAETQGEDAPDTVTVKEQGEYAIDIKGLLDKDPLVVHKDGAYLIHLPSLFQGKT